MDILKPIIFKTLLESDLNKGDKVKFGLIFHYPMDDDPHMDIRFINPKKKNEEISIAFMDNIMKLGINKKSIKVDHIAKYNAKLLNKMFSVLTDKKGGIFSALQLGEAYIQEFSKDKIVLSVNSDSFSKTPIMRGEYIIEKKGDSWYIHK